MDLLPVAAVIAGLVLLTVGGDQLISGVGAVARRFGMRPATVGATVVAVATSAPELAVSVDAAVTGAPELAVGNVLGSNIANVLLVLGAAALIAPLPSSPSLVRRDLPLCGALTAALVALAADGTIGRLDGALLVGVFGAFLAWTVRTSRPSGPTDTDTEAGTGTVGPAEARAPRSRRGPWQVALGSVALVAGAELLVGGAVVIATSLGVGELLIGLTVVAIGTSLPELVAAVSAARKGEAAVAVGNAVGSNIANLGLVLGVPALAVGAVPVPRDALTQDVPVALAAVVVLWALARWRRRVGRVAGLTLLVGYGAYTASLLLLTHR